MVALPSCQNIDGDSQMLVAILSFVCKITVSSSNLGRIHTQCGVN